MEKCAPWHPGELAENQVALGGNTQGHLALAQLVGRQTEGGLALRLNLACCPSRPRQGQLNRVNTTCNARRDLVEKMVVSCDSLVNNSICATYRDPV
ncbi:hypothetical protein [Bythopirellula polymerisocia]|uniref:Uncharacterized protein n=1 Tax=Bythopirellula polymerisocia TaxID=2528003 RepID=A0A5C6CL47_9BACT|nr:hypothetical protein [Bythopirellula polymerisocia]TWU24795.1 hypothetical protein Pla144_36810 [Bythopirellula polymerisocia]